MSNAAALNRYLAGVEQRAFRMARYAVSDVDEAMDIVQEAMLTLARKYATKPEAEWPPLFFRILRNRITDFHRRRTVQRGIFARVTPRDGDDDTNPIDLVSDGRGVEPEFRMHSLHAPLRFARRRAGQAEARSSGASETIARSTGTALRMPRALQIHSDLPSPSLRPATSQRRAKNRMGIHFHPSDLSPET